MKKLLAVMLASSLLLMSACTKKDNNAVTSAPAETKTEDTKTEEVKTDTKGKVGFSVSTLNNPFFVTLTDGAKAKATELGIELTVVDASDDIAKQASDIEDLISKKVSVIIVNPVDSDAIAASIKDAKDAGIKIISVDRVVNGVEVESAIASDNVLGAKIATEYLVSLIGANSQVAELEGIPGASAAIERGKGFNEVAATQLDVVAKQTANFNRAEGLSVMENILQSKPDIKGVFAHNDEMALGALEAVEASGKDIKVVGFDATDDAVASVEAGKLAATIAQKPAMMGSTSIEIAEKLLKGETVEKEVKVEVELIKK